MATVGGEQGPGEGGWAGETGLGRKLGAAQPSHDKCDLWTAVDMDQRSSMSSRNTLCPESLWKIQRETKAARDLGLSHLLLLSSSGPVI